MRRGRHRDRRAPDRPGSSRPTTPGSAGCPSRSIDSLPEPGGQVTAMYPEKEIFDVAGFPVDQGPRPGGRPGRAGRRRSTPTTCSGVRAEKLDLRRRRQADADPRRRRRRCTCGAVLITGGLGSFTAAPAARRRTRSPAPASGFFVRTSPSCRPGRGDRRRRRLGVRLGARPAAARQVGHAGPPARQVPRARLHGRPGAGAAGGDHRQRRGHRDPRRRPGDRLRGRGRRAAEPRRCRPTPWSPRSASPPTSVRWPSGVSTLDKRHIVVDSTTATNLPRVFAAGDITEYPGKVRLIAVGFGEAATAVNNAAVVIDPAAHLFPGHSSDNG